MSSRANRPSPSTSATTQSVGTQMQGNDGNIWEVVQSRNGIKRWLKVISATAASPSINSNKPTDKNIVVKDVDDKSSPITTVLGEELELKKNELGQLFTLRKMLSPIAFERKLTINKRISDIQKQINDINFNIVERELIEDNLIDELFEQSFAPIQQSYEGVYRASSEGEDVGDFFAPNGERSKLSDALNQIIRTPDFLEWFGNWQLAYAYKDIDPDAIPCSKVVNKNYEPLVVWHGTGSEFSYFRFETFPAAYFAVTEAYSKWFAQLHGGDEGYTIPFFLNLRNPLDLTRFYTKKIPPKDFFDYLFLKTGLSMDDLEINPIFRDPSIPAMETWQILRNNAAMLKKLSENVVFDGIHFFETNPNVPLGEAAHETEAFIAFRADQCKIADPNRGKQLMASLKSFILKRGGKI